MIRWAANECDLIIVDHLHWDEEEGEHLLMLQGKTNLYLHWIDSGQFYEKYPRAVGMRIVISIAAVFALSAEAQRFFGLAQDYLRGAGYDLRMLDAHVSGDDPSDEPPKGAPPVSH